MNAPTPTALKLVRGNPGRRPIRAEPQPPVPAEMPKPPAYLTATAKKQWRQLGPELHRLGLLTVIDITTFAALCQAYGDWVEARAAIADMAAADPISHGLTVKGSTGSLVQNPVVAIAERAAQDMVKYGAKFGLSPTDRTRLAAGPTVEKPSKFGDLLASQANR
jgi:P27 family predicted phage terminase small subunit